MMPKHLKQFCIRCDKGKAIATCAGCNRWFCTNHWNEHRQDLTIQLEHIGQERDIFQRDLSVENENHPLMNKINEWEQRSIEVIRTMADKARQDLLESIIQRKTQLKVSLNEIMKDIETSKTTDDYTEIEVNKWNEQLKQLREYFEQPATIDIIEHDQTQSIQITNNPIMDNICTPIEEISTRITTQRSNVFIGLNDRWIQDGTTVAGGHGPGSKLHELYGPRGIFVNDEKNLLIADSDNHRIVEWSWYSTCGQLKVGERGRGNRTDRLDNPIDFVYDSNTDSFIVCDRNNRRVMQWFCKNSRDGTILISNIDCQGLAMDHQGFLYVSDSTKHEVRRYRIGETDGIIVAGGNGRGSRPDQLNYPTCLFVDVDQSIYVSDSNNNRIMKWIKDAEEGVIVAGKQDAGSGNSLSQLSNPRGIAVDSLGRVYVVDAWNHRVVRWTNGMNQGELIVGGNGQGKQANQLNFPEYLTFDRDGNLYVADCLNHRVQRFNIL